MVLDTNTRDCYHVSTILFTLTVKAFYFVYLLLFIFLSLG